MLKPLIILCSIITFNSTHAETLKANFQDSAVEQKQEIDRRERHPQLVFYCGDSVFQSRIIYSTSSGLALYSGYAMNNLDVGMLDTISWNSIDSVQYEGIVRKRTDPRFQKLIIYTVYGMGALGIISSADLDTSNSAVLLTLPLIPAAVAGFASSHVRIKDTITVSGSELRNLVLQREWSRKHVLLDSAPSPYDSNEEVNRTLLVNQSRFDDHMVQFSFGIAYPDLLRAGIASPSSMSTPFELSVRAKGNSFFGFAFYPESYTMSYDILKETVYAIETRMTQKHFQFSYEYSLLRNSGGLKLKGDILIGFTLRYSYFRSVSSIYIHELERKMHFYFWRTERLIPGLRLGLDRMMGDHLYMHVAIDQSITNAMQKDIHWRLMSGEIEKLNNVKFPLSHTSVSFGLGLRF